MADGQSAVSGCRIKREASAHGAPDLELRVPDKMEVTRYSKEDR